LCGALTDCLNGHLNLPIEKRVYCVLSNGLDLARLRSISFEFFEILKHFLRLSHDGIPRNTFSYRDSPVSSVSSLRFSSRFAVADSAPWVSASAAVWHVE
jgi:hypothetical protein